MGMFCHQAKIDAKMAEDYDCVYLTGGHGTCVDFHDNATLKALVEAFYAASILSTNFDILFFLPSTELN